MECQILTYKLLLRKTDVLKKTCLQVRFLGAPTHSEIIEFSNFLLQLKNQRLGGQDDCGFSIILILKGIITF